MFRCLDGIQVVRCRSCAHFFVDHEALAPGAIEALYAGHYSGFRDDPVFARAARRFVRTALAPRLASPAKLLDVGCGNGEFLIAAREVGYDVEGLDTSEAAVSLCTERGLRATHGDLLSLPSNARYQIVTLWDVVEHLTEPVAVLRRARELLVPAGILFIKTPRITPRSVYCVRALPRLAGSILALPAHLQLFRAETLEIALRRSGFTAIESTDLLRARGGSSGGSLPKRLKRWTARGLGRALGNSNLLVFARAT